MNAIWRLREAPVEGRDLAWREAGGGTPVVYLHDAGADTLASPALDDLVRDHRVLIPDLPGYGASAPPEGLDDARALGEFLAAWMARVDAVPAVLVGSSIGGWFAAETALAEPTSCRGLVLCGSAGVQHPPDFLYRLFALAGPRAAGLVAAAAGAGGDAAVVAAAAWAWHPHVRAPGLLARLDGLQCPTTVLWGAHDPLIPLSHGRALATAVPGARLRIVPAAGHLVALEAPDVLAEEVRRLGADLPPAG